MKKPSLIKPANVVLQSIAPGTVLMARSDLRAIEDRAQIAEASESAQRSTINGLLGLLGVLWIGSVPAAVIESRRRGASLSGAAAAGALAPIYLASAPHLPVREADKETPASTRKKR